jgi:glycosyltransferase involved in cell wall biosynthesis
VLLGTLLASALPAATKKSTRHKGHHHVRARCDLTVVGHTQLNDGIGKQATDLVQTLADSMQISFITVGSRLPIKDRLSLPPSVQAVLERPGTSCKGKVLIMESPLVWGSQMQKPFKGHFWRPFKLKEKDPEQIRIAYSMFESSLIPRGWVDRLNRAFDAVAVPDPFLGQVYRSSGVRIPIFVLPLGRDLGPFLTKPLKTTRHTPFVFATFNLCDRRKNTLKLVQAFARAFHHDPSVELHLCWRIALDEAYRQLILDTIKQEQLKNVIVEEGPVNFSEHLMRFMETDCIVNASTGEGFSIIPREAMALGIPAIVTNNTAQETICASGLVYSVPANIPIPAQYPWKGDFGFQYDCTVEDLSAAMIDVYTHYDRYLGRAPQCRAWASAFDLPKVKLLYLNLLKPGRVVLGSSDTILPDGIMTSNPKLFKKYASIFRKKRHR